NIRPEWLVGFTAIRVIFIPLFLFCNAQPREHLSVVFGHDYQYIIIMTVFALTNGYLMNMASLIIPKMLPPAKLEDAYQVNMVVTGSIL
ncbi:unnamed protein product, partial [Tenebrio molitor]